MFKRDRAIGSAIFTVSIILLVGLYEAVGIVGNVKPLEEQMNSTDLALATFAGGCFWCMEHPFEKLAGVQKVVSGYTGGPEANPTYEEVSAGQTRHLESVQIHYDEEKITYGELLDVFWKQIDPTDSDGQFVDRGPQYQSAIFFHTEAQRKEAEVSKIALNQSSRFETPIVTPIQPATKFFPAESYHQDYYKNHPLRYKYYRHGSGRDQFLKKVWK